MVRERKRGKVVVRKVEVIKSIAGKVAIERDVSKIVNLGGKNLKDHESSNIWHR